MLAQSLVVLHMGLSMNGLLADKIARVGKQIRISDLALPFADRINKKLLTYWKQYRCCIEQMR